MWWTPHPLTEVLYYQGADGAVPVLGWLKSLPPLVQDKCMVKLEQLEDAGNALAAPDAYYLRDGVHCLRIVAAGLLYRIFYFELSERAFVVSHGCIGGNLEWETERAVLHRRQLIRHPDRHLFKPAS